MESDLNPQPQLAPEASNPSASPVAAPMADPAAAPSGLDPSQYYAALEEVNEWRKVGQQLTPHEQRIKRLIEDPDAAGLFDSAYESYERQRESAKPKLGAEWSPETNPIIRDMQEVSEYVRETRKREEQHRASQQQERAQAEFGYAKRLLAERPDFGADENSLTPRGQFVFSSLATYARDRGMTIEQAWKANADLFATPQAAAPPRSLRADA
ncbi:MAG: hypothetical protein NVSMB64_13590 [Candidatus Velthaea sp.]